MSSEDRNPPPPPVDDLESDDDIEILEADLIEGTAFSKKWTLATLLKLGKEVEKEQEGKDENEAAEAKAHGIDISDDLEKDLCTLWDMSANALVCRYLEQWNIVDILISVITKSNAPRVVEVAIGILGNMACCPSIAMNFSENKQLRDLTLTTLGSSDAPTLIETARFLTTNLISNISAQELWLSAISNEPEVFEKLCFILKSSTNCDLLHAASNLVDTIMDIDEEIMMDWASTILIHAVSEAMKQVKKERPETVAILLHLLQILSTADTGVEILVECTETVLPLVTDFISSTCEKDDVLSIRGEENCIASAVSILDVLANTSPPNLDAVLKHNTKTLPNLLHILAAAKDTTPQKPPPRQDRPPPQESAKTNSSKTPEDQNPSKAISQSDSTKESSQNAAAVLQSNDGKEPSQDATAADKSEGGKETQSQDATVTDKAEDGKEPSQDATVTDKSEDDKDPSQNVKAVDQSGDGKEPSQDATAAEKPEDGKEPSQDASAVPQSQDDKKDLSQDTAADKNSSQDETTTQSKDDKDLSQDTTAVPQPADNKEPSQEPMDTEGPSQSTAAADTTFDLTADDDDDDDSDMEEIECVGEVTRESNMLTDVLMEFFCNLLENNESDSPDLTTCLRSCQKTHVDALRNSLAECAPNLVKVLDQAPTG